MTCPTSEEIDDRIDAWHDAPGSEPLHEALGWSAEEYGRFVADPSAIPDRPLPPFPATGKSVS